MTLGELNYVDTFETEDNSPFKVDNYVIIAVFMLVMPIGLMNLMVIIAASCFRLVLETIHIYYESDFFYSSKM